MESPAYRECPVKNVLALESLFTFSKRKFPHNYAFKGESHDFTEVVCVTDGKVGITAEKNVYILSAGQMIIHLPGEFHAIWSDCGTEPEIVIFSFRSNAFPEISRRVFALSPDNVSEIKSVFRAAQKAFQLENTGRVQRLTPLPSSNDWSSSFYPPYPPTMLPLLNTRDEAQKIIFVSFPLWKSGFLTRSMRLPSQNYAI